jgi:hypothetical protein
MSLKLNLNRLHERSALAAERIAAGLEGIADDVEAVRDAARRTLGFRDQADARLALPSLRQEDNLEVAEPVPPLPENLEIAEPVHCHKRSNRRKSVK